MKEVEFDELEMGTGKLKSLFEEADAPEELYENLIRNIDTIFELQGDSDKPVYLITVSEGITVMDMAFLDACFKKLGLLCAVVPEGMVDVIGTVTKDGR